MDEIGGLKVRLRRAITAPEFRDDEVFPILLKAAAEHGIVTSNALIAEFGLEARGYRKVKTEEGGKADG